MQRIMIMTFNDRGYELGKKISENIQSEELKEIRVISVASGTLYEKTKEAWKEGYDLVFISAIGIAVRAVAGLIDSKLEDRAVIAMDEEGKYIVPVLSGHVGGADRLAREIAGFTGGSAVITSASDVRGMPAFDEWASEKGFAILNKERIAPVYDKVLAHEEIKVFCERYDGEVPFTDHQQITAVDEDHFPDVIIYGGCDAGVIKAFIDEYSSMSLIMASRYLIIGVGCRKGISAEKIIDCVNDTCEKKGLDMRLIGKLATIDLKKDEEGIKSSCARNRWKFETFPAEELREVQGDFQASLFVEETTGVDNVCERAAVRAGGRLLVGKTKYEGVTVAVAIRGS